MSKESKKIEGKKEVKYEPQIYPGADPVSERRRKIMDPKRRLIKLRDIPDDDIVKLLGDRPPGALYSSVHPPLDELMERYDPIKEIVVPTPGARYGDRIRLLQMSDSFWRPPMAPWLRARMYFNRFRGVDTVIFSGRELLEMRERDLEAATKLLAESEVFDPARTAFRGITVHGTALRLDEDGLMFDARRRYVYDKETKEVVYIKDQHAKILDEPIPVGRPLTEEELAQMDVTYRWDTYPFKSRTEILNITARIGTNRIYGGFKPDMINGR